MSNIDWHLIDGINSFNERLKRIDDRLAAIEERLKKAGF